MKREQFGYRFKVCRRKQYLKEWRRDLHHLVDCMVDTAEEREDCRIEAITARIGSELDGDKYGDNIVFTMMIDYPAKEMSMSEVNEHMEKLAAKQKAE